MDAVVSLQVETGAGNVIRAEIRGVGQGAKTMTESDVSVRVSTGRSTSYSKGSPNGSEI